MNPHYPGLVPMMVPQQIGGQQYMMAVRLPTTGLPAAAQPYMTASMPGLQYFQNMRFDMNGELQGLPVTLAQQVIPAGHLAASPAAPQAAVLAAVQSPAQASAATTVSSAQSLAPGLITLSSSLPSQMTAGFPTSMLAQYGIPGMPGLAGMSLAGGHMGLMSAGTPLAAGHMAMAGTQFPGLAEWTHAAAGPQIAAVAGASAAQLATGIAPSAYSQQVANLANAQLAGLQAQHMAGIPAHLAQYGSQLQAAHLTGLQMAIPQTIATRATPPPASTLPDNKKKLQQDIAAAQTAQMLHAAGYGYAIEHAQAAQSQFTDSDNSGDDNVVMLDDYNSDLSLVIDENGYGAQPLVDPPGFCFCWSGVRCTHGVTRGKTYFECKLVEALPVDFGEDHQETDPHIVRVGWSMDSTSFQLGEEPNSFGYGGTGMFSTSNKFTHYGEKFLIGDVIGALLDLDSRPPNISYVKNGRWLGVAHPLHGFHIGKKETAMFPHILTKNIRFEVNFGQQAPWFPPAPGFMYIMQYPVHERVRGLKPPSSKSSCEMIMIIGLPGSGKTTWGINKAKQNPEMRYNIIGTDTLIDKMKVMGLPRKNNYHGRWDVLIDKASKCLNKLFEIASKKKRNLILDQTNVYPSARRRKMRNFKNFIRRAAVIVPDDQELKRRSDKRTYEDGKYVPEEAVLDMKANFKLPQENDDNFDYIEYVELPREKAVPLVEQYNQDGQAKRPQAVKSGPFRGNQPDNRFKPPADLKQPPLPSGPIQGSLGPQNSSNRPHQPPPTLSPDQYGSQQHRDRSSEPPEKRPRYDQQSSSSALDFIKQEYSTGEAELLVDHYQERKPEVSWPIFGEQFIAIPPQLTAAHLQEQFAGRGLIAVGPQPILGHLQPGQGILGEYGSRPTEPVAVIAYGAQPAFVGGFNPLPNQLPVIKQETIEQTQQPWQVQHKWQDQNRGQSQNQSGRFDSNRGQNKSVQQNLPNQTQNQDQGQNRNQGSGNRPGSASGNIPDSASGKRPDSASGGRSGSASGSRPGSASGNRPSSASESQTNATPPRPQSSRPNQFNPPPQQASFQTPQQGSFQAPPQGTFQRSSASPAVMATKNASGPGNQPGSGSQQGSGNQQAANQNRFGSNNDRLQGNRNHFNTNQNQDDQNFDSQDDKQFKRERRRPSKWDSPEENKDDENATDSGQQEFQNVLFNLRSKLATQETSNQNQDDKTTNELNNPNLNPGGPPKGNSGTIGMMNAGAGLGQVSGPIQTSAPGQVSGPRQALVSGQTLGPGQTSGQGQVSVPGQTPGPRQALGPGQTLSPGQAPSSGQTPGPGMTAGQGHAAGSGQAASQTGPFLGQGQAVGHSGPFAGPGPNMGGTGPGPKGPRGMNPRGPAPGGFNGSSPFGQPGPRGPRGLVVDGQPHFGGRGRGGFQERGPPLQGNRGPPPRPFGPRADGDGPRGPSGWNPRQGCPSGGPPRGFNPRMGGPPGPRGPFQGPPGRFNRPPPPMGQQHWQRPLH